MKKVFSSLIGLSFLLLVLMEDSCKAHKQFRSVRLDIHAQAFENFSDYGFFKNTDALFEPNKGVIPYKCVNRMFNDYSERESFIYLPATDSLRFDRVFECVQMVVMEDDNLDQKIDFCTELAIKLGIRMAVAGVLVRKIVDGLKANKTHAALKQESADFLSF